MESLLKFKKAAEAGSRQLNGLCVDLEQVMAATANITNVRLATGMNDHAIQETKRVFDNVITELKNLFPEEDDEEPSIDPGLLESDSDSSEPKNKKKERDEYDDDEGFVESDSKDPKVYDKPKYDTYFNGRTRRSTRKKQKAERYSDVAENEQYGDDPVDDLMQEEEDPAEEGKRYSSSDKADCQQFITMLDSTTLDFAIAMSPWFKKRYGTTLEMVRDNLGNQASNKECLILWDRIVDDSFLGKDMPKINAQGKNQFPKEYNICGFCNNKRKCRQVLTLRGNNYPIGVDCCQLVEAVINFFSDLSDAVHQNIDGAEFIMRFDRAICNIQVAHANKQR